jgi:hypothetical protein
MAPETASSEWGPIAWVVVWSWRPRLLALNEVLSRPVLPLTAWVVVWSWRPRLLALNEVLSRPVLPLSCLGHRVVMAPETTSSEWGPVAACSPLTAWVFVWSWRPRLLALNEDLSQPLTAWVFVFYTTQDNRNVTGIFFYLPIFSKNFPCLPIFTWRYLCEHTSYGSGSTIKVNMNIIHSSKISQNTAS